MAYDDSLPDTILDFGQDLLAALPEGYTMADIKSSVNIIITVWNAVVIDVWESGNTCEAELLTLLKLESEDIQEEIKSLIEKKKTDFGEDLRGVGNYEVSENEDGSFVLSCEARQRL